MSVRLTLVSAPVSLEERYGAFAGAGSTEPAFGLLCLAAVARRAGYAVNIVEASARGLDVSATVQRILAAAPDVVGFTATTAEVHAAAVTAAQIKAARPETLTVLGGCHASALPAETLETFASFDFVVTGEGEETLLELLARRAAAAPRPWLLAGTAERVEGQVRVQPPRPLIADLDTLPLPAWDLLEDFPRAFRPAPTRILRWPCASVVLTRGCPNQCVFCDRSVFGNRCRAYTPAYAVQLVQDLRQRFGVREILIEDDTFVIVPARVREFCERLLADRVDVTWSCLGRADRVAPDLLRLMRRAGCWHISYGIESGDPAILQAMRKHLDLEQVRRAVRWSREAGLRTKGFFIVGFPGETPASLERTLRLARSLPLDDISVMQMTPFPGSELYRQAEQYGVLEKDWRRMNALNTVFVPHGFTARELEQARSRLLRRFYLRPVVLWRQAWHVLRHPRLLPTTLRAFTAFWRATAAGAHP